MIFTDPHEIPPFTGTSTVVDQVYERLRSEIESGVRLPGSPVREKAVADEQGVSQASVRQALVRLQSLDLVVRIPQRETIVANPTREDIKWRMAVRKPLETQACQEAARRFRDADFDELEHRLRAIGSSAPRADEAFHHYIWEKAENPLLVRTLKQLAAPMFAFLNTFRTAGLQNVNERFQSHAELAAALRSGRDPEIARAVERHINSAYVSFEQSGVKDVRSLATQLRLRRFRGAASTVVSLPQAFLRSVPAVVAIRDPEGRLVYANREFERFVKCSREQLIGHLPSAYLRPEIAAGVLAHDALVREKRKPLLTVGCFSSRRMTLRFPIDVDGEVMTGALGIDVGTILGYASDDKLGDRVVAWATDAGSGPRDNFAVHPSLVSGYLNALPATAIIRDPQKRILWTNREYERFTGQAREDLIGTVVDDWQPAEGGTVGRMEAVYRTYDVVDDDRLLRMNIRFPLLGEDADMDLTAALGFDFGLIVRGRALVSALAEGGHAWQPLEPRSLTYEDQLVS